MRKSVRIVGHGVLRFAALTLLFALLNYMSSALSLSVGGLTTVKPFGGIALALCFIYGRGSLWLIVLSGALGGIIAKFALSSGLMDSLLNPSLAAATLLGTYLLSQRLIGRTIDFRAWRQLVGFIIVVACVSAVTAILFASWPGFWSEVDFVTKLRAWFIPTTLSYVIFTPVVMLLATAKKGVIRNNWRRIAASQAMLAAVLAFNFIPLGLLFLFTVPLALLIVTMMCGIEGTALGLVLTELVLTVCTVSGHGFSVIANLPIGNQLQFTQLFISGLIVVMFPAAAAITERTKLLDEMRAALQREEQVNQALREMAGQAQRANKAKSEFLASMSHELRTPLNAILGFSEILATQLYGPMGHAKYVEYADDVHKSGAHLLELINDVLDLAKIDAGKIELHEAIFSVSELVDDAMLLVGGRTKGHVRLEVCVPADIQILADKRLTKQILINLLSNAIKFTPKGGTITVGAQERCGRGLEIYVADTGMGMNAEQLEKAFSPYGQVHSQVAQVHQGTGLDLPIAQSLARLQGGDVIAQSTPGKGTRMTLILPERRIVERNSARTAREIA